VTHCSLMLVNDTLCVKLRSHLAAVTCHKLPAMTAEV
jgi:hypothetical protein